MTLNQKCILFVLPLILFLNKWIVSYIIFPNDFLITKILFDTPDNQYYPIIKSLAEINFYPSFNEKIQAENIFTFPYGSILIHAIIYKLLGNVSIIFSEFIFLFLYFIIIFEVFKHIGFSFSSAIISSLAILFIPTFFDLISFSQIPYLNELKTTTNYIFSLRFPRPQVSGFYYLTFIYLILKFFENLEFNFQKKRYAIFFAFIFGLIINSFFYFFIYCSLALFFMLMINYKKGLLHLIKTNLSFLLIFLFFFSIFLIPFILQIYLGEIDHSARMGMLNIDQNDKIYLIKFFFNSITRIEPIILFFLNILITFFIFKKFKEKRLFYKIQIFFYLYIASLLTPFLFIALSSKVIAMYHFADYILVNGLFYLIIAILSILNFSLKDFRYAKTFKIFFATIVVILFVIQNYNIIKNTNGREHINNFNQILAAQNIINSKINLFTNDRFFANVWLLNNNSNLIISDGFTNAIKDETIILNLVKGLKLIGFNSSEFREIIDFEGASHHGRNPISTYLFNYKYQANKFHKFSSDDQFTPDQNDLIKKISPLRVMINILPKDEKDLFQKKFEQEQNIKNDFGNFFVVLNTKDIPSYFRDKNYKNFDTLYKKEHILILRKKSE